MIVIKVNFTLGEYLRESSRKRYNIVLNVSMFLCCDFNKSFSYLVNGILPYFIFLSYMSNIRTFKSTFFINIHNKTF